MHSRLPNDNPMSLAVDGVPPREGPEIFILRLKGNELRSFTIYSKAMWGIWTHWNGKKSEPHYNESERCPGCRAKRPKRWKGFVHAFCHEMAQEVFVELTPHSAQSLLDQLGTKGPLRGNRLQLRRTKGDNGRLVVAILTRCDDESQLPQEKDPQESILRLWGLAEEQPSGKEFTTRVPSLNGAAHR